MKRFGSNSFVFSMILAVSLALIFLLVGVQLAPTISEALAVGADSDNAPSTSVDTQSIEAPSNGKIQIQYYMDYYDIDTNGGVLPTVNTTGETVGGKQGTNGLPTNAQVDDSTTFQNNYVFNLALNGTGIDGRTVKYKKIQSQMYNSINMNVSSETLAQNLSVIKTTSEDCDYYISKLYVSSDGSTWSEYAYSDDVTIIVGSGTSTEKKIYVPENGYLKFLYSPMSDKLGQENVPVEYHDGTLFDYDVTNGDLYSTYSQSSGESKKSLKDPITTKYFNLADYNKKVYSPYRGTDGSYYGINSYLSSSSQTPKEGFAFGANYGTDNQNQLQQLTHEDSSGVARRYNRYADGYRGLSCGLVQSIGLNKDSSTEDIVPFGNVNMPALFTRDATSSSMINRGKYWTNGVAGFQRTGFGRTLQYIKPTKETPETGLRDLTTFRNVNDTGQWGGDAIWSNMCWAADNLWKQSVGTNQYWQYHDQPVGNDPGTGKDFLCQYFVNAMTGSTAYDHAKRADEAPKPSTSEEYLHNGYFGLTSTIDFTLSDDYVGPLKYLFYGDDDMWLYLVKLNDDGTENLSDAKLVCDIGGVHSSAGMLVDIKKFLPAQKGGKYRLRAYYLERGQTGSCFYANYFVPSETEYNFPSKTYDAETPSGNDGAEVAVGDTIKYDVNYINSLTDSQTITIKDTMSKGLSLKSAKVGDTDATLVSAQTDGVTNDTTYTFTINVPKQTADHLVVTASVDSGALELGQVINTATVSNDPGKKVLGNLKNPVVYKDVDVPETTQQFGDDGQYIEKKDIVTYKVDSGTLPYDIESGKLVFTDPILTGLTVGERQPTTTGDEKYVMDLKVKYTSKGSSTINILDSSKYSITGTGKDPGTEGKDDGTIQLIVTINNAFSEGARVWLEFDCTVNDNATADTTHVDNKANVKITTTSGVDTNKVHNPLRIPANVQKDIPVQKKTVVPSSLQPGGGNHLNNTWNFKLTALKDNLGYTSPLPTDVEAEVKTVDGQQASATDAFGSITYTKVGVYGYHIDETTKSGWTQGESAGQDVYVKITASSDKQTLIYDGLYSDSSATTKITAGYILFNNTYDIDNPYKKYADSSSVKSESTVVKVGQQIIYTVRWRNYIDGTATIKLSDTLSKGLKFINTTPESEKQPAVDPSPSTGETETNLSWEFSANIGESGSISYIAEVTSDAEDVGYIHNDYTHIVNENSSDYAASLANPVEVAGHIDVSKQTKHEEDSKEIPKVDEEWKFNLTALGGAPECSDTTAKVTTQGITPATKATEDVFGQMKFSAASDATKVYHYQISEEVPTKSGNWNNGTTSPITKDFWVKVITVPTEVTTAAGSKTVNVLKVDGYYNADPSTGAATKYTDDIVSYVNVYKPTQGQANIPIAKTTQTSMDGVFPTDEKTWEFKLLTSSSSPLPATEECTRTIKTTGLTTNPLTDAFGNAIYTKSGVYAYSITESYCPGCSCSDATLISGATKLWSKPVYVKIIDDNYQLKLDGIYKDENCTQQYEKISDKDTVHYINTFNPTQSDFGGIKTYAEETDAGLVPKAFSDGDFTVVVNSTFTEEGATKYNNKNIDISPDSTQTGKGSWSLPTNDIKFVSPGTYTYSVVEKNSSQQYVKYDLSTYKITYEVVDNTESGQEGHLKIASQTITKDEIPQTEMSVDFANYYKESKKSYHNEDLPTEQMFYKGKPVAVGDNIPYIINSGNFTADDTDHITFTDKVTKGLTFLSDSFYLKIGEGQWTQVNPTITKNADKTEQFEYKVLGTEYTIPKNVDVYLKYKAEVTKDGYEENFIENYAEVQINNGPSTFVGTLKNDIPEKTYSENSDVHRSGENVRILENIGFQIEANNFTNKAASITFHDKCSAGIDLYKQTETDPETGVTVTGLQYRYGSWEAGKWEDINKSEVTWSEEQGKYVKVTNEFSYTLTNIPANEHVTLRYMGYVTENAQQGYMIRNDVEYKFNNDPAFHLNPLFNVVSIKDYAASSEVGEGDFAPVGSTISYDICTRNAFDEKYKITIADTLSKGLKLNYSVGEGKIVSGITGKKIYNNDPTRQPEDIKLVLDYNISITGPGDGSAPCTLTVWNLTLLNRPQRKMHTIYFHTTPQWPSMLIQNPLKLQLTTIL